MSELEDKVNSCCADPATCCTDQAYGPQQERTGPMPALEATLKKRTTWQSFKRITMTTFGYTVVGGLITDGGPGGFAGFVTGLALSSYSEIKNKPMDLFWPAFGAGAGVVVANVAREVTDTYSWMAPAMRYIGAAGFGYAGYKISRK